LTYIEIIVCKDTIIDCMILLSQLIDQFNECYSILVFAGILICLAHVSKTKCPINKYLCTCVTSLHNWCFTDLWAEKSKIDTNVAQLFITYFPLFLINFKSLLIQLQSIPYLLNLFQVNISLTDRVSLNFIRSLTQSYIEWKDLRHKGLYHFRSFFYWPFLILKKLFYKY